MQIDAPVWYLRQPRCSCCDGEGELRFFACPECSHVVLICAEVGTAFRTDGSAVIGDSLDTAAVCPNCERVSLSSFRSATSAEIQALGFTPSQYA
jgi:hypothetical protein